MRRLERMVEAYEGKHKDLVKFISHQTCVSPITVRFLVRSVELKKTLGNKHFPEDVQPTFLVEILGAPDLSQENKC